MLQLLLVRHGHVDGIQPKRFRGRMELPLSKTGQAQATAAARTLAARYVVHAVWCSPLGRCIETAATLVAALSLPAAQQDPAITDTDYGRWQGQLVEDVERSEPAAYAQWCEHPETVQFPGGESLPQVAARTWSRLRALAATCDGQTVVVVTHDSVIRVALLSALGAPLAGYHALQVDPCSLSELELHGDAHARIVRINERTG